MPSCCQHNIGRLLVFSCLVVCGFSFEVSTVKNFRPVFPVVEQQQQQGQQDGGSSSSSSSSARLKRSRFYRSATLANLSQNDAQLLLKELGSDVTVIDLRNQDEINKEEKSVGSLYFYDQLTSTNGQLHHIPILKDVDRFWDETISRLPAATKISATLQTITQAGALDRAAARMLEEQGLSCLYTVLLATAPTPLRQTLQVCANAPGSVIFHCQKGKDRTGVVAMLLQSCCSSSENSSSSGIPTRTTDEEIIEHYAMSGDLLGENNEGGGSDEAKKSGGTMLDWSRFRGSPPSAMEDTLEWIRQQHGSIVEGYVGDHLKLDPATLKRLSERPLVSLESSTNGNQPI